MANSSIPHLYEGTHTDYVDWHLLVYHPFTRSGLTLLNEAMTFVFKLIDNRRTIWDIFLLAKRKDKRVTIGDIRKIFDDFLKNDIVYFNRPTIPKLMAYGPKKLSVWFHLTNQCNLRCVYCFVPKTTEKMSDDLAKRALRKVIGDSKKHGFEAVDIIFSGGECMMELPKIVMLTDWGRKAAEKAGIRMNFSAVSNGVLITDRVANVLKKNRIRVNVSMDGLGKFQDSQRAFIDGTGTSKYVLNGLANLAKNGMPVLVNATITANNIRHIPALTKYFLDNNIFMSFNLVRENKYSKDGVTAKDEELIKYLKKAYRIIAKNPPRYNVIERLLDGLHFNYPSMLKCAVGQSYVSIRHDGGIASCPMTIDKPMGTIKDDIVNRMHRGNFIRPRGLTIDQREGCRNCKWRYVCSGGCPIYNYWQTKSFTTRSPYCKVYKALIPEILKIEAKRLIRYGVKNN